MRFLAMSHVAIYILYHIVHNEYGMECFERIDIDI